MPANGRWDLIRRLKVNMDVMIIIMAINMDIKFIIIDIKMDITYKSWL